MKTKLDIQKIQNFLNEFNVKWWEAYRIEDDGTKNGYLTINAQNSIFDIDAVMDLCNEFKDHLPEINDSKITIVVNNLDYIERRIPD